MELYDQAEAHSLEQDIYAHAIMKGYELVLDLASRSLKGFLLEHHPISQEVTQLVFKGIFLAASRLGLMTLDEAMRWFQYRQNNRNDVAYYYGDHRIDQLLQWMPEFIQDAKNLVNLVNENRPIDPAVSQQPENLLFTKFLEVDHALHDMIKQADCEQEILA